MCFRLCILDIAQDPFKTPHNLVFYIEIGRPEDLPMGYNLYSDFYATGHI